MKAKPRLVSGLIRLIALCCLATAISACGQRGPLFLPEDAAQPVETVPPEEEKQDENKDS